jgi:hypothetical protein
MTKSPFQGLFRYYQGGLRLLAQAVSLLGEDDLVSVRLAAVVEAYTSARDQIAHFVEKADVIEDF